MYRYDHASTMISLLPIVITIFEYKRHTTLPCCCRLRAASRTKIDCSISGISPTGMQGAEETFWVTLIFNTRGISGHRYRLRIGRHGRHLGDRKLHQHSWTQVYANESVENLIPEIYGGAGV